MRSPCIRIAGRRSAGWKTSVRSRCPRSARSIARGTRRTTRRSCASATSTALAETDCWSALVDLDGRAEALGHYETALGDFRKLDAIAQRLTAVTAADVARVAREYLMPARRTIVIAEPEAEDDEE